MLREKSIFEIQELIKDKNAKEAGIILSKNGGIWYDWFCDSKSLSNRASKFITFIKGLEGEFTKNHYIWLKNNCPFEGGLYDNIGISPLDETKKSFAGFSHGNGETREREVYFYVDNEYIDVPEYKAIRAYNFFNVKNNKEAVKVVNNIFKNGGK